MLRDLAGMTGVALLTGGVAGAHRAWLGTVAYLLLAVAAIASGWTTTWLWPSRPPTDTGAALCATAAFLAGVAVMTLRGGHARVPALDEL